MSQESSTVFIGLDFRKDGIGIAVVDAPRDGEIRHVCSNKCDLDAMYKALPRPLSRARSCASSTRLAPAGSSSGVTRAGRACATLQGSSLHQRLMHITGSWDTRSGGQVLTLESVRSLLQGDEDASLQAGRNSVFGGWVGSERIRCAIASRPWLSTTYPTGWSPARWWVDDGCRRGALRPRGHQHCHAGRQQDRDERRGFGQRWSGALRAGWRSRSLCCRTAWHDYLPEVHDLPS